MLQRLGLHWIDALFVLWFLAVSIAVGLHYAKRAGRSLNEYFVSGRDLPWWALGTSMVATTFAADTPIVVSGFVLSAGIAKNWIWWNFLIGGALTVFVFARLWRRSGVLTEVELIDVRYSGAPAKALRGFKALYFGFVLNAIVFGWVTVAMRTVLTSLLGLDPDLALGILIGISLLYTALSGLWGVVATDVIQFAMAMVGSILLAALAVAEVGGLSSLVEKLRGLAPAQGGELLSFFPTKSGALAAGTAVLLLVNWWAVYYPGAEPGGGGYVAQRMLAAKDERHAILGTLWFTLAHYALRPWPWILVGLAAAALRPEFLDASMAGLGFGSESAYPWLMGRILPAGLKGLLLASFLAAYMSTITTQLNLAASYVVNDFARPFLLKGKTNDRALVGFARATVVVVTAIGCFFAVRMKSAGSGWMFLMGLTAGLGPVLILRWLWWRVNAWSEIAAMAASAAACLALSSGAGERLLFERLVGTEIAAASRERLVSAAAQGGAIPQIAREEALSFLREGHGAVVSMARDLRDGKLGSADSQRLRSGQAAFADLEAAPLWSGEFAFDGLARIAASDVFPRQAIDSARRALSAGLGNREGAALSKEILAAVAGLDAREVLRALARLEKSSRTETSRRALEAENLLEPVRLCLTVAFATVAWILATFLTRPVDRGHLARFVDRVRPAGSWPGFAPSTPAPPGELSNRGALLLWLVSAAFVFCVLFAAGKCLFLEWGAAAALGGGALVTGAILWRGLRRLGDREST